MFIHEAAVLVLIPWPEAGACAVARGGGTCYRYVLRRVHLIIYDISLPPL